MTKPESPRSDVTAIILAGGRSTRMGGQDKGLLEFRSRRLIEIVLERIQPQVDSVLISANRNLDDYRAYGYPVIKDETEDFYGPLAGIAACLKHINTPTIVTLPCDGPRLPEDLVSRLLQARSTHATGLAVAHDGQRLQPLYLCFDRKLGSSIIEYLGRGGRSVHGWIEQRHHAIVDFSDESDGFLNINDAQDLAAVASSANPPHISR